MPVLDCARFLIRYKKDMSNGCALVVLDAEAFSNLWRQRNEWVFEMLGKRIDRCSQHSGTDLTGYIARSLLCLEAQGLVTPILIEIPRIHASSYKSFCYAWTLKTASKHIQVGLTSFSPLPVYARVGNISKKFHSDCENRLAAKARTYCKLLFLCCSLRMGGRSFARFRGTPSTRPR